MRFAYIFATFVGSGADEVILSSFKTLAGTAVQFFTAIGTADDTREHIGGTHPYRSALLVN